MSANIQGIFRPEICLGYLGYVDITKDTRKIRGRVTENTIEAHDIKDSLDFPNYLSRNTGISYGTYSDSGFVVDERETLRVRREIVRCAPRIFLDRGHFYSKNISAPDLEYDLIEKLSKKQLKSFGENDYVVGVKIAYRFMNTFLGTSLERADFVNQIKKGKIIFYQRAPTRDHTKNRKNEANFAMLSGEWNELRLFRLCDLVLLAQ